MNPFNAIASIVVSYLEGKVLEKWARLLFELFFSSLTTFLFIAGSLLASTQNWPISIGSGMASAAVFATIVFRRSPLSKGMIVALPGEEAKAEINSDVQIIQKEK